ASVDEMLAVQVIRDARWRLGHGLGLALIRRGDRIYAGHGGAMPGYLSGLMFSAADRIAAVVLTSTSATAEPDDLAVLLCEQALEVEPGPPEPWEPGAAAPEEGAGVPGRGWAGGRAGVCGL